MSELPKETKDLIPHRAPMKMVDQIISCNDAEKSSVLQYTVPADSPFVDESGKLDSACYLEIIAQAAAAQHGFNLQRDQAEEEQGFLVGSRNVEISDQAVVGDTLTVEVACGTEIESVSSVFGRISKDGQEIASADITVWHGKKA